VLPGWVVWPWAALGALLVWRRGLAHAAPRGVLAARVALVLYLGWLAGVTFFALPVSAAARQAGAAAAPGGGWHADLVPLRSIGHLLGLGWCWPAVRLLAGNVLVFVPFGLAVPTAWRALASWRRMLLAGLCLSVTIELGQLALSVLVGYSYRVTEVDDVLLNVTGVLLGFALWSALRQSRSAATRRRSLRRSRPIRRPPCERSR
jgi:glycopeptide antibiotics resistance protein